MRSPKSFNRKNFLGWCILAGSTLFGSKLLFFQKKKPPKVARMLTQDGKLVEIDVSKLPVAKQKISDDEIHTWISNKNQKKTK